ncbi:MAG TPA: band 7 protein [Chitinophagaceae bacterium]|nr:band 7 protein [Chitinophagaceae bacterium]
MFFIFLGLVLIIVAPRFITKIPRVENMGRLIGGIRALGFLVLIIGLFSSCVKQIDAGYIGVQSLFGKIQKRVLHSGLNAVNPFVQIRHLDTRTQNYTMSGVHDEGDKGGDDAIRVLTRDGLEVTIDLSVLYRLNPEKGPDLIRSIGIDYKDKIIRPVSRTKIRDNAVYYDAVELYSTKRDEFQQKIFQSIEKEFQLRGLILENLLVRNITLPQTVKLTIESKINAEQEAQKMQFVLQKEKQEAERKRVEAQGIADYQRIISEGLSDKQLKYEQIKAYRELAASQNSKIIVMPQSGNIILDGRQ